MRQRSFHIFNNPTSNVNITTVIVGAGGGLIINNIWSEIQTNIPAFSSVGLTFKDSLGTIILSTIILEVVSGVRNEINLSGLYIPTTSSGGLTLVQGYSLSGTGTIFNGTTVIYTLP